MVQLPISGGPLKRIKNPGSSITINTAGKVLVIPTGNSSYLPSFNEYALDSNRLTIAESPFGGLKGAGSPDYGVGTIFINSGDGVFLTDINGNNSTKTLTAGKLKEVSSLTVDTSAKTVTAEFIIANTNTINIPYTPIDDGSNAAVWAANVGTGTFIESVGGAIHATGTAFGASFNIIRTGVVDLSAYNFLIVKMKSINARKIRISFKMTADGNNNYVQWSNDTRFVVGTSYTTFVLPLRASQGTNGQNPNAKAGTLALNDVRQIIMGVYGNTDTEACEFWIDEIRGDVGKPAIIEINTADNLADSSLQMQAHNGTSYQSIGNYKLDSVYAAVGTPTSANWVCNDGTKLDDCYPTDPKGRALYPKSISGATVNGSTGTLTYSGNKGTKNRIGLMVTLPPSDSGRTNFNKIRLKTILTYANSGATSYDFEDSLNASYGLQNMSRPFIALYDPAKSLIDFYLFTHRPKALTRRRNDSGEIYELVLYPGNGSIYHGQITNANLTIDSDSNLIPNFLESSIDGSVTKFLAGYSAIIEPSVIEFVTTGQTFAPVITTTGSPTILWTFSDGSTDATATPSKDFGAAAVRKHTLKVTPWAGLQYINVGYNGDDDGETPGQGTNLAAVTQQNVSAIFNLQLATSLKKIACSRNPITFLDVSGLAALTTIEAYSAANMANITLKNNTALTRLCVEACYLSNLDISGCFALQDLRTAIQGTGSLNINWAENNYPALYHVCIRDQVNISRPPFAHMPGLQILYIWNTGISGTLDLSSNTILYAVIASYNSLTNIILPSNLNTVASMFFNNNSLNQAAVDAILETCDSSGLSGKTINLASNTAPSASGISHKNNLVSKGWTVTTD